MRPDVFDSPVQRKADGQASAGSAAPTGSGSALPANVQAKMESSFGADFSSVRVHEGPQATAMGAQAYTQGSNIQFAPGKYQPDSQSGQELLGHELAHVVQQSQGRVQPTTQAKGVDVNDDASLEGEADRAGAQAARGEQVSGSAFGGGASASSGSAQMKAEGTIQREADPNATGSETGTGTGTGSANASGETGGESPTPGSATVVGAAEDSEYAFDNSFTPALVQALQSNPNMSIDEVLQSISSSSLGAGTTNDTGLHHPTIVQYGQTDANTTECRDNQKIAVLIPNQNYVNISPLGTPIAEANTMSTELSNRGYDSNVHADQTSAQMDTLWNGMVGAANEGDDLVAFYGGHGAPEGLCGIQCDFPPNPPDIYTNAQVEGLVSSATSKGAHIRVIMDSCHSGAAAQAVRTERQNELAENADSVGDLVRVAALEGITKAKQELLDHCHERETVLNQLDSGIQQHQAQQPPPGNAEATAAWQTILTGLQSARTSVQQAYDQEADRLWGLMKPILYIVKFTAGHSESPPDIADYRTLGAQINYLDDLWNTISQPMERDLAEQGAGGAQQAGGS